MTRWRVVAPQNYQACWVQHRFSHLASEVSIPGERPLECLWPRFSAIFVEERGRKLVISIEPMQRSIALDIEGYHIELA